MIPPTSPVPIADDRPTRGTLLSNRIAWPVQRKRGMVCVDAGRSRSRGLIALRGRATYAAAAAAGRGAEGKVEVHAPRFPFSPFHTPCLPLLFVYQGLDKVQLAPVTPSLSSLSPSLFPLVSLHRLLDIFSSLLTLTISSPLTLLASFDLPLSFHWT
ncbi:hypothetical protein BDW72DRAFT_154692 [Aspergillus terricola var. indicus]